MFGVRINTSVDIEVMSARGKLNLQNSMTSITKSKGQRSGIMGNVETLKYCKYLKMTRITKNIMGNVEIYGKNVNTFEMFSWSEVIVF